MHFKTTYLGQLRTQATHVASDTQIITDAPTDNHGKGETFSPTDLVATALTSCMITIMGIEANKLGIELEGITASTQKVMGISPRKVSKVKIEFFWETCELSDERRTHLKQKALTCPVALSLHPDLVQDVTFHF
ncbi:MAG: OsmC family protein [Cyclobacteriaceae bacterium]